MKKLLLLGTIVIVALSMLYENAEANLIINGSFEDNSAEIVGGRYGGRMRTNITGTTIPGWNIYFGEVDLMKSGYWTPEQTGCWPGSDGMYFLEMTAFVAGGLEQTFSTILGHNYLVTFDMGGSPLAGAYYTMDIYANDQFRSYDFTSAGDQRNIGWTTKTFQFTADSSLTNLRFNETSVFTYARGSTLDNVIVTELDQAPVPEPATMVLVGLGGAGMAFLRRRKTVKEDVG